MTLKQSIMGHSVSMMKDTRGSRIVRGAPRYDTNTRTVVRIHLDIHHLHGSDVSEDLL